MLKIIACILALTICGCPTIRDQLRPMGVVGEIPLLRFQTTAPGIVGEISGSFFLFSGSVSGQIWTERHVEFSWSDGSKRMIWTLPLSKMQFVLDEDKKRGPTIEFLFDPRYIDAGGGYTLEQFDIQKNDPNSIIRSGFLGSAIVRISAEDFEREINVRQRE